MASLGSRIRDLRKENKLNQEDIAKLLSVSISSISQYEKNVSTPDIESLNKLANYFNVSMDYLFGRSNIRNPYTPEMLAANSRSSTFSDADLADIERILEIIAKEKGSR